MDPTDTLETPYCTIAIATPLLLVQRFKPTARFTPSVIEAAQALRDRFLRQAPRALLICIPKEVPLEPDAMNIDHFTMERGLDRIIAMAIVAADSHMRGACRFYFTWFQQPFPSSVFADEQSAMAWLTGKLDGAG